MNNKRFEVIEGGKEFARSKLEEFCAGTKQVPENMEADLFDWVKWTLEHPVYQYYTDIIGNKLNRILALKKNLHAIYLLSSTNPEDLQKRSYLHKFYQNSGDENNEELNDQNSIRKLLFQLTVDVKRDLLLWQSTINGDETTAVFQEELMKGEWPVFHLALIHLLMDMTRMIDVLNAQLTRMMMGLMSGKIEKHDVDGLKTIVDARLLLVGNATILHKLYEIRSETQNGGTVEQWESVLSEFCIVPYLSPYYLATYQQNMERSQRDGSGKMVIMNMDLIRREMLSNYKCNYFVELPRENMSISMHDNVVCWRDGLESENVLEKMQLQVKAFVSGGYLDEAEFLMRLGGIFNQDINMKNSVDRDIRFSQWQNIRQTRIRIEDALSRDKLKLCSRKGH